VKCAFILIKIKNKKTKKVSLTSIQGIGEEGIFVLTEFVSIENVCSSSCNYCN
jgi:hypothetical protein